ncbi:MAG: hypothetical protein ACU0DI_08395 [Paracoccaceae bacterium]
MFHDLPVPTFGLCKKENIDARFGLIPLKNSNFGPDRRTFVPCSLISWFWRGVRPNLATVALEQALSVS